MPAQTPTRSTARRGQSPSQSMTMSHSKDDATHAATASPEWCISILYRVLYSNQDKCTRFVAMMKFDQPTWLLLIISPGAWAFGLCAATWQHRVKMMGHNNTVWLRTNGADSAVIPSWVSHSQSLSVSTCQNTMVCPLGIVSNWHWAWTV